MMHTYQHVEKNGFIPEFWAVGYFVHRAEHIGDVGYGLHEWVGLSKHDSERQAIQRVNALNGGTGTPSLLLFE
jgi:hypothetical protein